MSHMNYSTGIGGYSSGGVGDDGGGLQANTATPLKQTLTEITSCRGVAGLAPLEALLGCLANQEDKLHALDCGLVPAVLRIYDAARAPAAVADSVPTRVVLVRTLRSLCILARGRTLLLAQGLPRTLALLGDPAPEVRVAACAALETLCSFPDSRTLAQGGQILPALVDLFLTDEDQLVTDAAVPPMQQLTRWDPLLDSATLGKLGGVISRCSSPLAGRERVELALLKATLQTVWNCALHSGEKEIAIAVGMVEVVAPLLEDGRDTETRRCASGLLAALAIAQSGKTAIIAQPGALAQACKLTLDKRAASGDPLAAAVRANSVQMIRNFTTVPAGLRAVGGFLVPQPETLLEVLGAVQTAKVLAANLAEAEAGSATAAAKTPLTSTTLLWNVRALQALLKAGPQGLEAAWGILDIVTRLYELTSYEAIEVDANDAANESAASVRSVASRCLHHLCTEHDDARLELAALGRRIGTDAAGRCEVFAAVKGSHLKVVAARQALEARQREEDEQAAEAALIEASILEAERQTQRALKAAEEAAAQAEQQRLAEVAAAEAAAQAELEAQKLAEEQELIAAAQAAEPQPEEDAAPASTEGDEPAPSSDAPSAEEPAADAESSPPSEELAAVAIEA